MNLSVTRKSFKGQRGFTIMEMLGYVILFAAFLSFAYRAVTASSRGIGSLQNNAYDIIRVTKAGERWRQDIRGVRQWRRRWRCHGGTGVKVASGECGCSRRSGARR